MKKTWASRITLTAGTVAVISSLFLHSSWALPLPLVGAVLLLIGAVLRSQVVLEGHMGELKKLHTQLRFSTSKVMR